MKNSCRLLLVAVASTAALSCHHAQTPPAGSDTGGIQWFATLESGLAEAKRTGRPILFVSAAPSCAGVSGIW